MASFKPSGQGTVRDAAGNVVGNRGQDFDRNYYRNKGSGSASSSERQVAEGPSRNPDGTYTPVIRNPEVPGRDPSKMNPVFARRLAQLNNAPDFEGYVSRGENTETYFDQDGRQRVVVNGIDVDTSGWTRIERHSYENQQISDFRPNPGRVYRLDHEISSDPNKVGYLNQDGDLVVTSKGRVPENVSVVYNNDGTLSDQSVNRLGLQYAEGSSERNSALDAEEARQQRLYDEQIERMTGMRISAQSRKDVEQNQQFGQQERSLSTVQKAANTVGYVGAFAAAGPAGILGMYAGQKIGEEIAPTVIEKYGEFKSDISREANPSAYPEIDFSDPEGSYNRFIEHTEKNKNENIIGKMVYDSFASTPEKREWTRDLIYNQVENEELRRQSDPTYAKLSDFFEPASKVMSGYRNETIKDPFGIVEDATVGYAFGFGLGKVAGTAVKSAKYGNRVKTAVQIAGAVDDVATGYDYLSYSTGLTIGKDGISKEFEFGSDEMLKRSGEWLARNAGGEIASGSSFGKYYDADFDAAGRALNNQIKADNLMMSAMSGSPNQSLRNYDGVQDLMQFNNELRNLSTDIIVARGRNQNTFDMEAKFDVMRAKRDASAARLEKRILGDVEKGIFDENIKISDRGLQEFPAFESRQNTMNIIGRDINSPEIRGNGRNVEEMPVGRNRQNEEIPVGYRYGYGNSTEIGVGQDLFGLEIDPRVVDGMFGYAENRKVRYNKDINEYDYFINENYDYSNNQNFEDNIQRIFGNPNIYGNRFRNSNRYGFHDKNQYAEDYKNRNEYDFRFAENFAFDFVPDFKFDFDFRLDPRIRIDLPELEETSKQHRRTSRNRKSIDRKDRNPFMDLLGF